MSKTWSSMPACRSPSSANRAGTVKIVKSCGSTVVDLVPADRGGDAGVGQPAHGVRRRDGVVAGVLVVVDEEVVRVAVLAPPGRRHLVGRPPLDLAGERQRRPAYVLEAVVGPDPHVDVHPLAAAGLREAGRAQLVEHLVGDVGDPPHLREVAHGPGSRSIRHSSGFSVSSRRLFQGWNSTVDICTAQITLRQLGDAQLVGGAVPAREVQPHRLDPRRRARRAAASGAPCRRPAPWGTGAACTAARRAR